MYILIVTYGYPTDKNPCLGVFEFEQAKALQKAGHKVVLAAVDLRSFRRLRHWGIEHLEMNGLEVWSVNIPCGPINKKIFNSFAILGLKSLNKKIFKQCGKPDIVHAHFGNIGYVTLKALREQDIPVVITEHSSTVINKDLSGYEIKCLKYGIQKADAFLCVSNSLRTSLIEVTNTDKEIFVVPNLVSPLFTYAKNMDRKNEFVFLSVGNLLKGKRFGLTIDAFAEMFSGEKNVRLLIGGDGPLKEALKQQIYSLNMGDQIQMLGILTRTEVAHYMHLCDAFVLASAFETFGVVYIEALACGKPVIGAHNGGADSIINETNGFLVDVDDRNQLAKAMWDMYTIAETFDGMSIARDCMELYGEEKLAGELTNIYKNAFRQKMNSYDGS